MFKSLMPWKKKHGDLTVRHDSTREDYRENLPMNRLHDHFNNLSRHFDDHWLSSWFDNSWRDQFQSLWNDNPFRWDWSMGWEDEGDEYVFRSELPGYDPDDFDIEVRGNTLTIRAEHKEEGKEQKGSRYHYGSYRQTFTLPYGADDSKLEANYHSGVLELHLPKTEEAKGKRIEVK